jgi:hypothetical protein
MKKLTIEKLRLVLTLLITANKTDPDQKIARAIDILSELLLGKA